MRKRYTGPISLAKEPAAMRPILPTFFAALMFVGVPAIGQQPITLNDVEEGLPEISPDEPIAKAYSATHAA
ncbi:hypothetical protein [Novipirellula galeiformis]|nr:hypothetical protein [Novipirellula galeiformis]